MGDTRTPRWGAEEDHRDYDGDVTGTVVDQGPTWTTVTVVVVDVETGFCSNSYKKGLVKGVNPYKQDPDLR